MHVSLLTLKSSDFPPAFKNQVNSTTHATTKLISSLHWKKVIFDPPHWNQFNLDHPHKNQVNFPAHPKNKWFSARIQVTNQSLPPTQQPNQFQHCSTPRTEIKSISTTITKTKSISMLTLKISNFRRAHKDKVKFDPRTENKLISVLTLKPSQFLPTQKQVNFDPHSKQVNLACPRTRKPS